MTTTLKEMEIEYNEEKAISIIPFDYSYMNRLIEEAFKKRKEDILNKFKKTKEGA